MSRKANHLIFAAVLLFAVWFNPGPALAESSPVYSLALDNGQVTVGSEVKVTVTAEHAVNLYGYEVVLEYEPDKLDYVRTVNIMGDGGLSITPILQGNRITFAHTNIGKDSVNSGNFNLSTFTFKSKSSGNSPLILRSVKAVNQHDDYLDYQLWNSGSQADLLIINNGSSGSSSGNATPDIGNPTADGPSKSSDGVHIINSSPLLEQTSDGSIISKWSLDATALNQAVDQLIASGNQSKIELEIKGNTQAVQVQLPADSLAYALSKISESVISIKFDTVSYDLPLKALNMADLTRALNSDAKDIKIKISIQKVEGVAAAQLDSKIKEAGYQLLTNAIEFNITAEANGNSLSVNDFGSTYVPRTLILHDSVNVNTAAAVIYDPSTGEINFVPALFTESNGTLQVTIQRTGNSIYTVVKSSKTFLDMEGHWAKADVEQLASKLLIKGISDTRFAPQNQITRAEFAILLVRGLGLTASDTSKFVDIQSSDWFAPAVGAAVKAGLIDGYEDSTFRPNANITREQMAVMITRAIALTGKKLDADPARTPSFVDASSISGWAKDAVARSVSMGIMNGVTDSTFAPNDNATRAQAAVMLKRSLQLLQFMN
ncbi:S-layer homology domain-containing protein [Paenibacillus radicis (ex Xue et al. 2023)]|uniref:S-layer homology domain-containing protein n=1 Tax=Paenibacillus radicis (ex Xue et al. 2023) TaxID=2972489 RepID=A0ABT1YJR3_9BACL|nr:S-layer homology domain-containing protein [Paenibacillus radicis (ex Xue et al. 2023)]MCR8633428.1 S-layer homology domain-containing protein [Paenibacillus radicis (ex Xue et al. 2023)]